MTLEQVQNIFKSLPLCGEFDISDITGTALAPPSIVQSVISIGVRDGFIMALDNGNYQLTEKGIKLFGTGRI